MSDNRARIMVVMLGTVALGQLNWYNLPALFPLMNAQLHLNVSELGVISAAFVVGFGFVQVPAGIIAAKVGLKRTVLTGALLISVFSLIVPILSNAYEIAAVRLVAGAGMALVYAPGMLLALRHVGEGRQSLGIGVYSAVGDVGGIAGIFGWSLLGSALGWRSSVLVSGTLGLAFALLLLVLLPRESSEPRFQVRASDLKKVLLSRGVLLVSFALMGAEFGWNALVYFIVFYLQTQLGVGVAVSGLVGGLILGGAILGALLMSRVYRRVQGSGTAFFIIVVACAVSVVPVSTSTLYGAALGTTIEGILNGLAFTLGLAIARKAIPIARYEALGVAWVNEIAIFGSFWATLLFSFFVVHTGYPIAWSATALLGILFMMPVLLLGRSNILRRPADGASGTQVTESPEPSSGSPS